MNKIEINGKQYPCRVTMGAMLRFRNEAGKDVTQLNSDDIGDLVTLLWCCVASASNADGVEFDMSLMDFADSLDPETVTGFYTTMDGERKADPEKKTE